MTRRRSEYYYAPQAELAPIVSEAKQRFIDKHPEYRVVQRKIESFIARAVEMRNEKGVRRPEDWLDNEKVLAAYSLELHKIATSEANRCLERFRHEVQKANEKPAPQPRLFAAYEPPAY